ncbi:MAG: hypothetical protein K2Q25_05485 [Mycobacteriaceae bacterium]|nr:hypothetical protein [Mycobacteriaceae bacterium]
MAELPASTLTVRSTAIIDEAIATVKITSTTLGVDIPESGKEYGDRAQYIRAIAERLIANNSAMPWTGLAAILYSLKGQMLAQSALFLTETYPTVKIAIERQAAAVTTARTRINIVINQLRAERQAAIALNNSGCIAASISLQNRAALAGISASNHAIENLQTTAAANAEVMDTLRLHVQDRLAQLMSSNTLPVPSGGGSGLLQVNAASLRLSSQQLAERSLEFAEENRVAMVESIPAKVARTHGRVFTETFDSALETFERNQNILLLRIKVQLAELAERLNSAANALERIDIDAAGALL